MIYELVRNYQGNFNPFCPYAAAGKRESWESLDASLKEKWVKLGESFRNMEYPLLTAVSYMDFCNIGDRAGYEKGYFARRRMLYALVMAECVEGRKRFLNQIVDGIIAICEESGWQLPAHNHYGTGVHYKLPDITNPVMDLFACETAAGLAMTAYLLKEELDGISPFICERIHYEIRQRILIPYLKHDFFWKGKPGQKVNNWTAWCTQNTLIALLSMELPQDTIRQIMEQAARSLDIFLDSYGQDGCCNEGASYYRVAGLCLFNALEVMNFVTDNALEAVYRDEKIRNIAPYILNVHIADEYYANYADCAPTCEKAGAREYLFAKRVGNINMMRFAAKDFKENKNTVLPRQSENLFYYLQSTFTSAEIYAFDTAGEIEKPDIYYESVGLFLARDSENFLAVKAGGNDDSHNHNDTGSLIFYKKGKPVLIDVGVETYSRKTFSPQRYEIWTMQSAYHNVLTFGNVMQNAGREYHAEVLEVMLEPDFAEIEMELSGCYPEGSVKSYRRTVEFVKDKSLRVRDLFSPFTEVTYLSLMTAEKPVWKDNMLSVGELAGLHFNSGTRAEVEEIQLTDVKLKKEWGDTLYRTKIYPDYCGIEFTIKFD